MMLSGGMIMFCSGNASPTRCMLSQSVRAAEENRRSEE